eukprot:scaffold6339_cov112-Isochrysis_galbana.AAC.12
MAAAASGGRGVRRTAASPTSARRRRASRASPSQAPARYRPALRAWAAHVPERASSPICRQLAASASPNSARPAVSILRGFAELAVSRMPASPSPASREADGGEGVGGAAAGTPAGPAVRTPPALEAASPARCAHLGGVPRLSAAASKEGSAAICSCARFLWMNAGREGFGAGLGTACGC